MEENMETEKLKPKRRGPSIATKLDAALHDAEVLHRTAKKPYCDGLIAKMRLVYVRIETLRQLLSRKHNEKLDKLKREIAKLTTVINGLKSANQRLASELVAARAPKATGPSQVEQAHAALAK